MAPIPPLLAALLLGTQFPAQPAPDVVDHVSAPAPSGYWSRARMAGALPIDVLGLLLPVGRKPQRAARWPAPARVSRAAVSGSRWSGSGAVTRTTGRVFMTMNGTDFVCSAGTVRSANKDVVVTAGHCVKDAAGAWAQNWTFVPGYHAGREPYGRFAARHMFVAGPWSRSGDDSYDLAMVALSPQGRRHVADAVGTQEISFTAERGRRAHGFGYAADPPYDGQNLVFCSGTARPDPHELTGDQGLRCDLTAGASGGPWLSDFDPATGRGVVTSVHSFKYSDDSETMYGPYLGSAARQVFQRAERA